MPTTTTVRSANAGTTEPTWVKWTLIGLALAFFAVFLLLWSGSVPNSLLRYSIVLFPVWIALAQSLSRRPVAGAYVLVAFGLLDGFLMAAWTLGKTITI